MDVVPPAHPTVTSLYLCYEDLVLPPWEVAEGYNMCSSGTGTYGPVLPDLRNSIKFLGFLCLFVIYFYFCVVFIIAEVDWVVLEMGHHVTATCRSAHRGRHPYSSFKYHKKHFH